MNGRELYRALTLAALVSNPSSSLAAEAAPDAPAETGPGNLMENDRNVPPQPSVAATRLTEPCPSCTAPARENDDGVDLSASLGFEAAANVSGGARHRVADADQLVLSAAIDAEQVLGLRGGTFKATVTYRRGKELERVAGLETLQQVQEVYGRGQTWRLTQFWYQQRLGAGADVKFGRLTQGEDFGNFSCEFMNLTFCGMPAGNIAGDYWFNWPISQWGARVRVSRGNITAMAGLYENNPRNLEKKFTIGRFHGATGVLVPVEFAVAVAKGPSRLPGSYKVGAWYNSSNADDVGATPRESLSGVEISPRRRSGRYGVYLQFQQQLTGSAINTSEGRVTESGLVAFLNITQADRRTSLTDNQIAVGLSYTGVFAARPKDRFGVAFGRTNINGRAMPSAANPATHSRDAEYVAEVDYGIHVSDWLTLRPNIQYVLNPGGNRHSDDLIVVGLRGAISI